MSWTPIYTLLEAAVRAPSGDNLQPWLLAPSAAHGKVAFQLDPSRDPSPMNAGQRMSRIAVGAALENAVRTARHNAWEATVSLDAGSDLALLDVTHRGRVGEVEPLLRARVTNRRIYDGRAVERQTLESLRTVSPQDPPGVRTHWIGQRALLDQVARLISRADAVMFGRRAMRLAFLSSVRFDLPASDEAEEGLSLASLELKAPDRLGLRLMSKLPEGVLKLSGALKLFSLHALKLARSASGLCIITAADDTPQTDLNVGRALQSAWLNLTAAGLQVQPMMSLPVLDNVLTHRAEGEDRLRVAARSLLDDLRETLHEVSPARIAAMLRFGHAPPPSGRTGRLPLDRVVRSRDNHE